MSAFHMFKSVREYLTPVLMSSAFLGNENLKFYVFLMIFKFIMKLYYKRSWNAYTRGICSSWRSSNSYLYAIFIYVANSYTVNRT